MRRSNWRDAGVDLLTDLEAAPDAVRHASRAQFRARLMKAVNSVPTIFTSRPHSFTSVTSQVTTEPFLMSPAPDSAGANGSPASCLTPSEMRSFSTSTSRTTGHLDHVALLVLFDDLLARTLPVEVGQMDHAVDVAVEAQEQAEFGLVLDLALDTRCRTGTSR